MRAAQPAISGAQLLWPQAQNKAPKNIAGFFVAVVFFSKKIPSFKFPFDENKCENSPQAICF